MSVDNGDNRKSVSPVPLSEQTPDPSDGFARLGKFLWRHARRVGIAIAGTSVLIFGLFLAIPGVPGPGFVFVLAGLGILSLEFIWPRTVLRKVKEVVDKWRGKRGGSKGG